MGHFSDDPAERKGRRHPNRFTDALNLRAERPPAVIGLDTEQQHEVSLQDRGDVVVERGLGPGNRAGEVWLDLDLRPNAREIVEAIGVQLRELLGAPSVDEVPHSAGSDLSSVDPTGKRQQQDRSAKDWLLDDLHSAHALFCSVRPLLSKSTSSNGLPDPEDELSPGRFSRTR